MGVDRNLQSRCGATRRSIAAGAPRTNSENYCADCQSFARHLKADAWLDAAGGTEIFQTLPHHLAFVAGE